MHLADGILTHPGVLISGNAIGAGLGALVLRAAERTRERGVVWTGTLAAFVLAAQALNVPLVPGASAHVIGAGLLTLALGPGRAALALLSVVCVQALLFADGGITTLGINALHIALIPTFTTHFVARRLGPGRLELAALCGTLLGNALSAASLALMLTLGAGASATLAFGWLVGVQSVAGLIEGILTALAVRQLRARAPALLHAARAPRPEASPAVPTSDGADRRRGLAWAALAVAVIVLLLPLASRAPDALDRVVGQARP